MLIIVDSFQSTIHDLFEVDQEEADAAKRMAAVLDRLKGEDSSETEHSTADRPSPSDVGTTCASGSNNKAALGALESALAAAEDETDVAAARTVRAEVAAEMAEFDESAPVAAEDADGNLVDAEVNKAEMELQQIEEQVGFFFSLQCSRLSLRSYPTFALMHKEKCLKVSKSKYQLPLSSPELHLRNFRLQLISHFFNYTNNYISLFTFS